MTDKADCPDPNTLEGEELNYWAGIAACKEVVHNEGGRIILYDSNTWDYIYWNPIKDANQCLEISGRCFVLPDWNGAFAASVIEHPQMGKLDHWQHGATELIARCRAVVARWRDNYLCAIV